MIGPFLMTDYKNDTLSDDRKRMMNLKSINS